MCKNAFDYNAKKNKPCWWPHIYVNYVVKFINVKFINAKFINVNAKKNISLNYLAGW